jgi:small subunit ribosomal protein S17
VKAIIATVVSAKMNKTAVVVVNSSYSHPMYQKIIRRSRKFLVHDEFGVKAGDNVVLKEIRPMSKNKHLAITEVVKK